MKLTQSKVFWILQVVGWNILAINSWAKYFSNTELNKFYIVAEGFLLVVSGILVTCFLRLYLKRHMNFTNLDKKILLKICMAYIAASMVFSLTLFLAIPIYNYFHDRALDFSKLMLISNILNAFIFILMWLIFYISIKTLIHLRKIKIEKILLKTELKEAQLNTLKGQINPHFMFNSLNNIRGLMLEDVVKARDMITRLSEMLRFSLTKNSIDTIAMQEEIEMVNNYIALTKIQFEDRLIYNCSIPDELLKVKIPPMIIQMLIENAVKHGISNQTKGGLVTLSIKTNGSELTIEVTNTGNLIKQSHSTKLGLNNIKKRLQLIYKNSASFELLENGNNVVAKITLPDE